jgi:hypothetical protein
VYFVGIFVLGLYYPPNYTLVSVLLGIIWGLYLMILIEVPTLLYYRKIKRDEQLLYPPLGIIIPAYFPNEKIF